MSDKILRDFFLLFIVSSTLYKAQRTLKVEGYFMEQFVQLVVEDNG